MSDVVDPSPENPPEQGISLRELTEAFAQVMAPGAEEVSRPADRTPAEAGDTGGAGTVDAAVAGRSAAPAVDDESPPPEPSVQDDGDPCETSPLSILEAMLFVGNQSGEPLSSARAAELMRGVEAGEIPDLVEQLNRRYQARACPYRIVSEGPGFRLALRREFWPVRNRFYGRIREARLSQAAIDVLSIVAYRQPVTADEVTQMRGHPSGHLVTQLVRRRLLRVERSAEQPRLARYCTTERFLALFGLESLDDLPKSDE